LFFVYKHFFINRVTDKALKAVFTVTPDAAPFGMLRRFRSNMPQYAATCRTTEKPVKYRPSCTTTARGHWPDLHMTEKMTGNNYALDIRPYIHTY